MQSSTHPTVTITDVWLNGQPLEGCRYEVVGNSVRLQSLAPGHTYRLQIVFSSTTDGSVRTYTVTKMHNPKKVAQWKKSPLSRLAGPRK